MKSIGGVDWNTATTEKPREVKALVLIHKVLNETGIQTLPRMAAVDALTYCDTWTLASFDQACRPYIGNAAVLGIFNSAPLK